MVRYATQVHHHVLTHPTVSPNMSLLVNKTPTSVNIGTNTGGSTNTVSIGTDSASGNVDPGLHAVAIGYQAGIAGGVSSVSVGDSAAATGTNSVAIGTHASATLSNGGVAIGAFASVSAVDQAIVINGTNALLQSAGDHTFVVHPISIRAALTNLLPLYYDTTTNEIVAYNASAVFTLTYLANGAGGTPPAPVNVPGGQQTQIVNPVLLTFPAGTAFKYWNTKKNGSGTSYYISNYLTMTRSQSLYAIWGVPEP